MSTLIYKLYLQGGGMSYLAPGATEASSGPVPVSTGSKSQVAFSDTVNSVSINEMHISLYGLSFRRQLYDPGHIQAEMLIQTPTAVKLKVSDVTAFLLNRAVKLAVMVDSSESDIATNYYIFEISPKFETKDDCNFVYVKLDIFSQDKLLTLNKFSKAHLGKKLFGDIVDKYVTKPSINIPLRILSSSKLQNLGYKNGNTQEELVHPYLIQYNESFHDFIKRIANRCGEAFYFESGGLCFGLDATETVTPVSNAKSITFQRISGTPLSVRDYYRDSLKQRASDFDTTKAITETTQEFLEEDAILTDPVPIDLEFPKDAFPRDKTPEGDHSEVYNLETAPEDQYMILYKDKFAKDDYSDVYFGDAIEHVMQVVSDFLNSTSLLELFGKYVAKVPVSLIRARKKQGEKNDKGNEKIKKAEPKSQTNYAVLFTGISNDTNHWISVKYYHDIRCQEEDLARRTVCIDMGTGFQDVKLGDRISIPEDTENTYIVIQIDIESSSEWINSYEGFSSIPAPYGGKQYQRIYAMPMTSGTDKKFYPPLLPGKPFCYSGPQPAFITDSGDPLNQGRVRIRFPWQPSYGVQDKEDAADAKEKAMKDLCELKDGKIQFDGTLPKLKSGKTIAQYLAAKKEYDDACEALKKAKRDLKDDSSPWIRMATPMATNGGGMYFSPAVGDEVMVDFENGNIERPYVVGALYSKNVPAPDEGSRVIVSPNGHTIKMSDPTDVSEFVAGAYPGIKYLKSLGVKFDGWDVEGDTKCILGGIEFSDKYGFYNIKMSSGERNISISSPFGDISMNALTGISIEAPNGDITITGKNVEISAYNKVSIESGKNVDAGRWGMLSSFKNAKADAKTFTKSILGAFGGKFFDLSLLRSLIEIGIRPIDGTFSLKSNRYLLLEAGKGGAATPSENQYDKHWEDNYKFTNEAIVLVELVPWLKDRLNDYVDEYITKFNVVVDKAKAFAANDFNPNTVNKIKTPANKRALLDSVFGLHLYNSIIDLYNGKKTFLGNTSKFELTAPPPPAGAVLTQAEKDSKAAFEKAKKEYQKKVGDLINAVNAFKKCIARYDHIFDAPVKSTIPRRHISSILGKLGFSSGAHRLDTPILQLNDPTVDSPPTVNAGAASPATAQAGHTGNTGLYGASLHPIDDAANSGIDLEQTFSADIPKTHFDEWKKLVLRRLMCAVIEKIRSTAAVTATFSIPAAVYPMVVDPNTGQQVPNAPVDEIHPFEDSDWGKYVSGIDFETKDPTGVSAAKKTAKAIGNSIGSTVLDTVLKVKPEASVWRADAQGEILFSDHENLTYQFKNNGVSSHQNKTRELSADKDAVKKAMTNI
ncbi:MAG: hypothetical protein J5835_06540 [Bacteroidales bacterium]|nr:hypothetical protein [Bacteroidales bacterium]